MRLRREKVNKIAYFLAGAFFVLLALDIYYFGPKISHKFQEKINRIQQGENDYWLKEGISLEYFRQIKRVSMQELVRPYIPLEAEGASRQNQQYGFWWPTALLTDSLEVSHRIFSKPEDLQSLIKFYNRFIDKEGIFLKSNAIEYLGNAMHANTLIYLSENTNDKRYRQAAEQLYIFKGACTFKN